jgi:uncharacterized protein YtpQ (UPF0354 family)
MFGKLFSKSDGCEDGFRKRVVEIVSHFFPGTPIDAPAEDGGVIRINGIQIGLQNLRAKFEQSDKSQQTLEELVKAHAQLAFWNEPENLRFEAAQSRLKPQLMPLEYTRQAPVISFPFGQTLAVGIVLDDNEGYSFVRTEDAERWQESHAELLKIALTNLDEASRGKTKMEFHDKEETKWVGIEMKDGFDAARILLPGLQKFLATRMGSPFRFAVPNRDFLICWNTSASPSFTDSTTSKIRKDFKSVPYPLSPNVFELGADGTIHEI